MKRRSCVTISAVILLLLSVFAVSCNSDNEFYLGNGKDKDDVREEIFGEDTKYGTEDDQGSNVGIALPDESPQKVYFTSSGSVWHTRKECSHLKKSTSILEGSLSEAKEKGKTKQCSSCQSADEKESTDSDEDKSGSDDLQNVFWIKGGSVWHKSSECSYISDSADLQNGSLSDAQSAGIEKPCSRCAKENQ